MGRAAEQRVAALVAKGGTHPRRPAALFLAEPTVASHLSHVYTKLGILLAYQSSRANFQKSE